MMHGFLLVILLLFAAPQSQPAAPATWRVVTYNIHIGKGMDTVLDLERIARVLEQTNADVIALQEVDVGVTRSGGVDQATWLGERLKMQHAFGEAMEFGGGRYGIAILTKHRLSGTEVVRLPDGREPRVALRAVVERADGARVSMVAVHLDHVQNDTLRYAQAEAVAKLLDGIRGPWLLAGDFNDVPGSRTIDLFAGRALNARKPADAHFTFPAGEPVKEIDFIFAAPRDAWRAIEVRVVAESVASDHRPVLAVLEFSGEK